MSVKLAGVNRFRGEIQQDGSVKCEERRDLRLLYVLIYVKTLLRRSQSIVQMLSKECVLFFLFVRFGQGFKLIIKLQTTRPIQPEHFSPY